MQERIREFGDTMVPPASARARVELVQALVRFVKQGLRGIDGRTTVDLSAFSSAVVESYISALTGGFEVKALSAEEARADAFEAFKQSYLEMARRYEDGTPLPALHGWGPQEEAAPSEDDDNEPDDFSVHAALKVAKANAQRARMRVLCLYCLGAHLPRVLNDSRTSSAAGASYAAASEELWKQVKRFEMDIMMFAIVVGGKELAAARAQIVNQYLGPSNSVMQYLSMDGQLPSRWLSSSEQAFRDSVPKQD